MSQIPAHGRVTGRRRVTPGPALGKIGFVGLGVMGRPMASNLLAAGADLIVHNRSREAQDALVTAGAAGAGSPAGVAAAGIIITMLADDQAVRAVLGDGLIPVARPGTLLIDMSTVSPALSRELAARAAERDVRMLDAPVSGGDAGAREGTLSIMVGGDPPTWSGPGRSWGYWAPASCTAGPPARAR